MTKHTPGPWEAKIGECNNTTIYSINGKLIALFNSTEEDDCNARLIATAPELLSACVNALNQLEYGDGNNDEVIKELKDIIRKAKGE